MDKTCLRNWDQLAKISKIHRSFSWIVPIFPLFPIFSPYFPQIFPSFSPFQTKSSKSQQGVFRPEVHSFTGTYEDNKAPLGPYFSVAVISPYEKNGYVWKIWDIYTPSHWLWYLFKMVKYGFIWKYGILWYIPNEIAIFHRDIWSWKPLGTMGFSLFSDTPIWRFFL